MVSVCRSREELGAQQEKKKNQKKESTFRHSMFRHVSSKVAGAVPVALRSLLGYPRAGGGGG